VADSYVPVVSGGQTYNIDNESIIVAGVTVYRQRTITCSPSNPLGKQEVGVDGAAMATDGGLHPPVRIPSGTSTGFVIKGSAGRLCRIIFTTDVPGSELLLFYDDPNGAANNLLVTIPRNTSDAPVNLQIATINGISMIPSAALTADVLVEFL
jgi:hypothetical protein